MRTQLNILFVFLFASTSGISQLYLPNAPFYNAEVERISLTDSIVGSSYYNRHLSLKPILDKKTDTDKIYLSSEKQYYWITQKLFKENFIVFEGKDFWCSIDPVLDLELGGDLSADSTERLYWNTRGIRVQANFFDKVGFTTLVYENQAILPNYQSEYVNAHGEFFPNTVSSKYTQQHAVIPGYSRTKPFKTTGYDFAFAEGNVAFVPNKFVNFQLGNGNHFIGNGYRSLLLSDYSSNYAFGKIEVNLWNGRIQYNTIYALHQNLYRLSAFTTPEATYEKKIGTYHYLDIAVTKNLQIGLFEGSLWKRVDSLGSHRPDGLFANPIPFVNTLVKGFENTGFKSIIGINASYALFSNVIYGQIVIDNKKVSGYQIGAKFYDLIVPKFDGGIEFNHVDLNTYLSSDKRYNYSNNNLPLAHPYVGGFDELIINLSYQHNRFFIQNRFNYSNRTKNNTASIGNDILSPTNSTPVIGNYLSPIFYNQFEIGYRFNKTNNLQFFIGQLYRNESNATNNALTNYAYIGIRTKLRNKYLEY